LLTEIRINDLIEEIKHYSKIFHHTNPVIVIPSNVQEDTKEIFKNSDIVIWDLKFLYSEFKEEILKNNHPIFQNYLLYSQFDFPRNEELFSELKSIKPGKEQWATFQKKVEEILEKLFCPPLEKPISESSDFHKLNRRDTIFPNYSDEGIWKFLRNEYKADFVVVEAKNYKNSVNKGQILQIVNYLKYHGAGLFGIIVSRKPFNRQCELLVREKWISDRKMIINLTDNDLKQMLFSQSNGENPEKLIVQKIEDFRLKI